jgi:DNA-binding MarR family transcriptional regulator
VVSSTGRRVEFLARAIVNRLEDRGLVEFRDAEAGILVVTKALEESFAEAEAVEREARRRLGDRATDAQVEEEMQKIAAERKIVL